MKYTGMFCLFILCFTLLSCEFDETIIDPTKPDNTEDVPGHRDYSDGNDYTANIEIICEFMQEKGYLSEQSKLYVKNFSNANSFNAKKAKVVIDCNENRKSLDVNIEGIITTSSSPSVNSSVWGKYSFLIQKELKEDYGRSMSVNFRSLRGSARSAFLTRLELEDTSLERSANSLKITFKGDTELTSHQIGDRGISTDPLYANLDETYDKETTLELDFSLQIINFTTNSKYDFYRDFKKFEK